MATVLVVDDHDDTRKPLMRMLQLQGYTAVGASTAYEAMAMAKKADPDLILLDVMIPPMDGLTFLMLLRNEIPNYDVPVILITGLSDANTVARAQGLGVKEYLVKTQFKYRDLMKLVHKYTQPADEADAASPSA